MDRWPTPVEGEYEALQKVKILRKALKNIIKEIDRYPELNGENIADECLDRDTALSDILWIAENGLAYITESKK